MNGTVAALAASLLLTIAPPAAAQEVSPFSPVGESLPPGDAAPAPQQAPAPPAPQPAPVAQPDDELSTAEVLPLMGMSLLLFVAVGVAIMRDSRKPLRSSRRRKPRRRTLKGLS